jgi:hypothetical protein
MADFSQLKHLQIRASNFIGTGRRVRMDVDTVPRVGLVEFLPGSIEGLWISDISKQAMGSMMRELVGLVTVSGEGERFGELRRVDVEGRKWLKESVNGVGEEQGLREMHPDYAVLLRDDILGETEEVRCACLERGVEFRVRDSSVEVLFEEEDDVFLFVRGDEDEEDE